MQRARDVLSLLALQHSDRQPIAKCQLVFEKLSYEPARKSIFMLLEAPHNSSRCFIVGD